MVILEELELDVVIVGDINKTPLEYEAVVRHGVRGSGKKYGGFGSDDLSYGSYSGQVYGSISRELG